MTPTHRSCEGLSIASQLPTLRIATLAALTFFTLLAGSRAAEPNPYEFLNDRYSLSFLYFQGDTPAPAATFFVTNFRILGNGLIRGKANFYESNTRVSKDFTIRGRVQRVRRSGDFTKGLVTARAGSTKIRVRVQNFRGRPEVVRGVGKITFRGQNYRQYIDNQRQFSRAVRVPVDGL